MESTLSLTFNDLAGDVGDYLGYGRGAANGEQEWSAQQEGDVGRCLKSGLRQFYYPEPLPGEVASYDWSFLKPVGTLVLAEDAQSVVLPDDFGGIEGRVSVTGTTAAMTPWPVELTGEGALRASYAVTPTRTGRPLAAAVVPLKPTGPNSGQRFQLNVYPIADQDYTLQVSYYLNPDYLTAGSPYPLGGLMHAETIREACLMAAENFKDDASTVHSMKFLNRLAASVNADRKNKPQVVGYNRDRSDQAHLGCGREALHGLNWGGITYNGTQY